MLRQPTSDLLIERLQLQIAGGERCLVCSNEDASVSTFLAMNTCVVTAVVKNYGTQPSLSHSSPKYNGDKETSNVFISVWFTGSVPSSGVPGVCGIVGWWWKSRAASLKPLLHSGRGLLHIHRFGHCLLLVPISGSPIYCSKESPSKAQHQQCCSQKHY